MPFIGPPITLAPSPTGNIVPEAFLPKDTGTLVDPEVSWLYWHCNLVVDEDDRIACNVPLAGVVVTSAGGGADVLGGVKELRDNKQPAGATVKSSVANILQRVSGPVSTVRLVGQAIRLCYPVAHPVLYLNGVMQVQKGRRLVIPSAGSLGGFPVFGLSWDVQYALAGVLDSLPTPADPMSNVNGSGS